MWGAGTDGAMAGGPAAAGPHLPAAVVGRPGPGVGAAHAAQTPHAVPPHIAQIAAAFEQELGRLRDPTAGKPVYNMLSMLAGEQKNHPDGALAIANVLQRKLTVERGGLPFLWLVDSIVKNERGLFPRLFDARIPAMFLTLYKSADPRTRGKILHVRKSWGKHFSDATLRTIDAEVARINAAERAPHGARPADDVSHALARAEAELVSNRLDPRRRNELVALVTELKQRQPHAMPRQRPPHTATAPPAHTVDPTGGYGAPAWEGGSGVGVGMGGYHHPAGGGPLPQHAGAHGGRVPVYPQHGGAVAPAGAPHHAGVGYDPRGYGGGGPRPMGPHDGYRSAGGAWMEGGAVSQGAGPAAAAPYAGGGRPMQHGGAPYVPPSQQQAGGFVLPTSPESLDKLVNSLIPDSLLTALTSASGGGGGGAVSSAGSSGQSQGPTLDKPESLSTRFDHVIASLYDALPLQDMDSGARFPAGADKELADHKDWLFRARERSKRAEARMGRGWYVDTETWVLLTDSKTEAEKKKASAFESIKAEDEEDPEEVLKESVLCTNDNKNARCSCGCNEALVKYYDDDREEWRYKSTVERKGKLLHAQHWLDIDKSGNLPSPLKPSSPLNLAIGSSQVIPGMGRPVTAPETGVGDDEAGGGGAEDVHENDGARTPPGEPDEPVADSVATAMNADAARPTKKLRI
eukprot:m.124425 g.124425  ORF g.124425 m.124425 type:complete len:689 (-) comp11154_c0_seq3:318-2384(-)